MLWNDEKHNFAQVIDQVQRALREEGPGPPRERATQVAINVDSYVRHAVLRVG